MNDFKLLNKARYLLIYAEKYIILSIPKVHKIYRDNLTQSLINLNTNIIRARNSKGKIQEKYIFEIITEIEMLDLLVGLLMDLKLIESKRFMSFVRVLNECRKMTLAWKNSDNEEKE